MRFVWRMALRETRAAWRRLLFFFLCVAIGVGSIVALRSVIQTARTTLTREAHALLGADVLVYTNRPWTAETRVRLDRQLAAAAILARTDSIQTATMVRPADEARGRPVARMVELRAVQEGFPFYGELGLEGRAPYRHALVEGRGVLVRPELLAELGLAVGDAIVIGNQPFTIRGVITSEPGRQLSAFSLGPRVIVDYDDLLATGLLTFGSRARYEILLRVREHAIASLVERVQVEFGAEFVRARSYRSTENRMGENLRRAEDYLSLVGFVIVVLGGVGVWSVMRVFMRQKLRTIAVLKCVGATTPQVLATYLVQVLALAVAGCAVGVALAVAVVAAVPPVAREVFGEVAFGLTGSAVAQGVGVGVLVSLLFALVPLLDARHVKPLLLLRAETAEDGRARRAGGVGPGRTVATWVRGIDWTRAAASGAVGGSLVLVAAWQAASWGAGLAVCLGFLGVATALHLTGLALVRLVRPLARSRSFPLRHAVLNVARPGNQTRVILLAVGLGSFFILGVRSLQTNLLREVSVGLREDAPDMFLIDVQSDQAAGVRAFLAGALEPMAPEPRLIPVLRARVTGVRGQTVNLDNVEDGRGRGSLGREYVVTYRDRLEANETVVEGRFWGSEADAAPVAEVSIERGLRDRFDLHVGDTVRFDIVGRVVEARVASVREVEWEDSRAGGFMFVFRPDVLEQAPHTFIVPLKAPQVPEARARMQRDLVIRFPNVSAIDVREILENVRRVLDRVTLAVVVVGAVGLVSGLLILVGAVAMTKFQRRYEAAVFRTLGASTHRLASMLALEYAVLGALAGAVGALGALALSWGVSRHVLDIGWQPDLALGAGGVVVTTVLVGVVGVTASLDVLRNKPLGALRVE